jgi:hypothetical protein
MTHKHPVDAAIERMSKRDQRIANELYEAGNSDEDLYVAIGNEAATRLLQQPIRGTKRKAARGMNSGAQTNDGEQKGGA